MKFGSSPRLALFAHPGFSAYLIACFLSTFGSGLSYITANWLILSVHNDVITVLVMMICFWLPNALLGPYWGVIVDRYSRKWLLVWSNLVRAIILLAFAWYVHRFGMSVVALDVLMLLLGSMFGLILPASIAFVRELVPAKDLLYANTTIDIIYEVGNVVGMASAGFLLAAVSGIWAFTINGILFLLATIAMMTIKLKPGKSQELKSNKSMVNDFVIGLQYLGENKTLSLIYMIQLLIMASFMITPVLIAPFAKNILHASSTEFSLIEAGLSFGIIVGGICLPWLVRLFGFAQTLFYLTIGLVIFFILFAFNSWLYVSMSLYFAIGFVLSSWPLIVTKAQGLTKFAYQGRVQSVFSSVSSMLVLVTYLFVAIGAHFFSLNFLYLFPAALAVAALFLIWRLRLVLMSEKTCKVD